MTHITSLCYWYPRISGALPTPRTVIVPLQEGDIDALFGALDGKQMPDEFETRIINGAASFNYPLFMRTDFNSAKHNFFDTCYVKNTRQIISHAVALFEDTICNDITLTAFVFREFLQLESGFVASGFRGLPISKERRYFVEDGKVLCHHPYWPEDAIRGEVTEKGDGWKDILRVLNTETADEIETLSAMATTFSRIVPGAWSVDFAKTKAGEWVLIDAAEAFRSWHPSDCPIAFGVEK
ncbi:MAG: ATP-grasp domain-containing protein [Candidatus Paceibacterota bacterium]